MSLRIGKNYSLTDTLLYFHMSSIISEYIVQSTVDSVLCESISDVIMTANTPENGQAYHCDIPIVGK